MAARIKFPVGRYPDSAYIEVWGSGTVLPDSANNLPPLKQRVQPGFNLDVFDNQLNPVHLKVKAGIAGTIKIKLVVHYDVWEKGDCEWRSVPGVPVPVPSCPPIPDHKAGDLSCSCTWGYSCTKEGELSYGSLVPDNSKVDDDVQVKVESARSEAKPKSGDPYVMFIPVASYTGNGTKGKMNLKPIYAYLNVTDKIVPPPPKLVPTATPVVLGHVVYFKTGESNADHFPNPNPIVTMKDQIKDLQNFMNRVDSVSGLKNIVGIDVHGYASGLGDTRANINLSQKRADYVAQLLRQLYHIQLKEAQITPHGEPPIAGNDNEDKWENRRAELVIKIKAGAKP